MRSNVSQSKSQLLPGQRLESVFAVNIVSPLGCWIAAPNGWLVVNLSTELREVCALAARRLICQRLETTAITRPLHRTHAAKLPNIIHASACIHACVHTCAHARVRVCVWVRGT